MAHRRYHTPSSYTNLWEKQHLAKSLLFLKIVIIIIFKQLYLIIIKHLITLILFFIFLRQWDTKFIKNTKQKAKYKPFKTVNHLATQSSNIWVPSP